MGSSLSRAQVSVQTLNYLVLRKSEKSKSRASQFNPIIQLLFEFVSGLYPSLKVRVKTNYFSIWALGTGHGERVGGHPGWLGSDTRRWVEWVKKEW